MTHQPERFVAGAASCTIHRDGPPWKTMRTATLGAFACETATDGAAMLSSVCEQLKLEGFEAVIGPMDGDTWHRYRVVSESDGSAPFLMEPTSGVNDRAAFEGAGFSPISSYQSTRARLDDAIGDGPPFQPDDLVIRAWDGQNVDGLVRQMFAVSSASFARNAFFKPISEDTFLDLYRPLMPAIDPRLVLFAHLKTGKFAGFLFGMPDHLQGPKPRTAILKTYASSHRGAGHALADRFHRTARELGFSHVIHALMHEENISRDRSARHQASVFRRYALMGKRL